MKKYNLLYLAAIMCCAITLTSCFGDDDTNEENGKVVTITEGLFVLNEGNMASQIGGSLSYLDFQTATMQNNVFRSTNLRELGGTPNDILLYGKNIFIAVTDENRVEITDGALRSLTTIEIKQPRCMTTDGKSVFVTNYEGVVTKIDIESRSVVGKSKVIGGHLEGISFANNLLYVCNSHNADYSYNNNVVKLDPETLEQVGEITVVVNPVKTKASGKDVYVMSSGDYVSTQSQVQKISENDAVSYVCDATLFDVYDGTVYAINSITDWQAMTTTNEYFYMKDGTKTALQLPCSVDYPCAMGVDPNSGLLFISSYQKGASGMQDYSGSGLLYAINLSQNVYNRFEVGVGPTRIAFICVKYLVYE